MKQQNLKNGEIQETLQKEIEFFKKEVSRLAQLQELKKQQSENFFAVREMPIEKEMSFNNIMSQLATPN